MYEWMNILDSKLKSVLKKEYEKRENRYWIEQSLKDQPRVTVSYCFKEKTAADIKKI